MVLPNLNFMQTDNIEITLLRLKDGRRLLRLTVSETGLALEQVLNPNRPLLRQKQTLRALFDFILQRAETSADESQKTFEISYSCPLDFTECQVTFLYYAQPSYHLWSASIW